RYGKTETANHRLVYGEEGMARLEGLRERVAALLVPFEASFGKAKTAAEKTRALYSFLADEARLPDRIELLRDELTEEGRLEEAEELRQVWDALADVLEQLVELTADETVSVEEYKALLEAGLASKEIGLIPPAVDQVVIGPARRLATGALKALFVIGANEGLLPLVGEEQDLLSQEERKALLAKDRTFCRDGGWIVEEENLALYRAFAKPSELLWVASSTSDGEGAPSHPSELYGRMRAVFPENGEGNGELTALDSFETVRAALPHLAKALSDQRTAGAGGNGGSEDCEAALWREAYDWFLANEPDAVAPVREGLLFRPGTERIRTGTADELYRKTVSPSRLEQFSRCPFRHFIDYGLEPEEKRPFASDPRSTGDVYHYALMELSKRLSTAGSKVTAPGSRWMTIGEEELEALCSEILGSVAADYREGLLGTGETERYRKERIGEVFFETAKALVRQVCTGRIEEMYLEEPFGRKAVRLPAIPVKTTAGTYLLEGRIDRVDVLPGDFIKIIDYKSGGDTFRPDDAKCGWRLQLMLYLTAATQSGETPAGALYFHVTDKDVDVAEMSGSLAEVLETGVGESVRKAFAMNGIVLDNAEVLESIVGEDPAPEVVESLKRKTDGSFSGAALVDETAFRALLDEVMANVTAICTAMFDGDVSAEPKEYKSENACKYCDYKAICRRI
ncbi:MAG: PD-(D/E)XK nuclease family protein, partial [Firmicutes bacterium]|nr:PD-(D/E)XK nuclease family protein [Bacillota bacterium]